MRFYATIDTISVIVHEAGSKHVGYAAETEESMNQKMQEEPKWKRTWHFIRPTVISVAVVLLAFFIMQGRPLATTLDRRTDLVSVVVTQNGAEQAFTRIRTISYVRRKWQVSFRDGLRRLRS